MLIFRKKVDSETLADLSTRDIARCCGVSQRTARGWKRAGPPPAAARLLALATGDMETIAGRAWRGWHFRPEGILCAPDGTEWDTGTLAAWWIERQELPTLRAALARVRDGVPVIDRGELERLQRAVETMQTAAHSVAQLFPRAAAAAANGDVPPMAPRISATR